MAGEGDLPREEEKAEKEVALRERREERGRFNKANLQKLAQLQPERAGRGRFQHGGVVLPLPSLWGVFGSQICKNSEFGLFLPVI